MRSSTIITSIQTKTNCGCGVHNLVLKQSTVNKSCFLILLLLQVVHLKSQEMRSEIYSHIFVEESLKDTVQELVFGAGCNSQLYQSATTSLDSRVIGGEFAKYGSQPWQVEISETHSNGHVEHHCSGAILNAQYILTTAHCFSSKKSIDLYIVIAGDYSRSKKDDHEQIFKIEAVTIHPNHKKANKFDNDIAIVKLKPHGKPDSLVFGAYVQPACIPTMSTPHPAGTSCTVSGWGITEDTINVNSSAVLRSAQVQLISTTLCQDLYSNYNPVGDGMLCAGYLQGGVDACKGDSGGPLICNITGHYFLSGLVSWGDGCARPNRPGVYVRVQHYLDWIRDTLKAD